jgi:hypothetical protein
VQSKNITKEIFRNQEEPIIIYWQKWLSIGDFGYA